MTFLTDFADQAVILPLVLAVAAVLALQGWPRGAIAWLLVVGATFATMLFLKLIFLACAPVFGAWHTRSPSGHVAAATVVAGGLAFILTRRPLIILPVALAVSVLIAASRVALQVHSLPEVVLGSLVGLAGTVAFLYLAGPPRRVRPTPVLASVAAVVVVFHGSHLPAEAVILRSALQFADYIPACRTPPTASLAEAAVPPLSGQVRP
ncbi:MAG: phosphatase PAP2 family protein [Acetobacteraceae bacterium]